MVPAMIPAAGPVVSLADRPNITCSDTAALNIKYINTPTALTFWNVVDIWMWSAHGREIHPETTPERAAKI